MMIMSISVVIGNEFDNSYNLKALSYLSRKTDNLIRFARFLLGIIGVVLIIPIITIFSIILFLLILRMMQILEKGIKEIYNEVNLMSREEIIQLHLNFESTRDRLHKLRKMGIKGDVLFLFKPFFNRLSQVINLVENTEQTLKRTAYPDLAKPLSKEHTDELRKKLSHFEDWNDDELDIYKKIYC